MKLSIFKALLIMLPLNLFFILNTKAQCGLADGSQPDFIVAGKEIAVLEVLYEQISGDTIVELYNNSLQQDKSIVPTGDIKNTGPLILPLIEQPLLYESSIINISSTIKGGLYLNNTFIKNMKKYDFLKIKGIVPGDHILNFKTTSDSLTISVNVEKDKVYSLVVKPDTICIIGSTLTKLQKENRLRVQKGYLAKSKGFYNATQVEFFYGDSLCNKKYYASQPSISTVNGYRFSPLFCLGLGLAYYDKTTFISDPLVPYQDSPICKNLSFLPVYLDFRFDLLKTKVTPYAYANIGYSILLSSLNLNYEDHIYTRSYFATLNDLKSTGVFLSIGFGAKFYLFKSVALTTSFSCSRSSIQYSLTQITKEFSGEVLQSTSSREIINLFFWGFNIGFSI